MANNQAPLIIKIGTNVITTREGRLDTKAIARIVQQIAELKKQRRSAIVVTSGAMGAGRALITPRSKHPVARRQVLAAVGQVKLMTTYARLFERAGHHSAQVLATREDFRDRRHYLNMKNCFEALLQGDIVPIVNENDAVSVDELMFTDNDELAGLIAAMLNADKLLMLTTVDGILDKQSQVISAVTPATPVEKHLQPERSEFGRGGMVTKCRVGRRLARLGIPSQIVNGKLSNIILKAVAGEPAGTTFAAAKRVSPIKKWLAQSAGAERGTITINECAVDTLRGKTAASLLPVGITAMAGSFSKGEIVKITGPGGGVVGYGQAAYGAAGLRKRLGKKNQPEFIHYDYLYIV